MSSLMLINPRKRRTSRRKTRSPAQRAATARMLAANRARRSPARKRHHNPITVAAPARRRRRHHAVARVAHHVRRRARRHHNPISLSKPMAMLMPALQGAAGALAVNALVNYIPLPAMLTAGKTRYLTKAAFAILLGTVGRKFLGHTATKMAEGALTVTATDALKDMLSTTGINLGDVGMYQGLSYYSPAAMAGLGDMPGTAGDFYTGNRAGSVPVEQTLEMYQDGGFVVR